MTEKSIIYGKCIYESQIAKSIDDFKQRQSDKAEKHNVYYKGETTRAKSGADDLCSVPLNLIFHCLKHGTYLAIVEECSDLSAYPYRTDVMNSYLKHSSSQKIIDIMEIKNKKTIDFIFDSVGDSRLVTFFDHQISNFPRDLQAYIKDKCSK